MGIKGLIWKYTKKYIPQKVRVMHFYRKKTGRKINLKNPERFSDKLGWYKLYYKDELMRIVTDKSTVRDYVKSCGLDYLLNDCYGVYERAEDIEWEKLPDQFVLKNTLGGASNGVLLVFDKSRLDVKETEKILNKWIKEGSFAVEYSGQWIYEKRKAKIVIEKLLISNEKEDLPDYKFFCFDGRVYCSYLMRNYTHNPHDGENAFLDRDFNLLPVSRTDYQHIIEQPEKPKNYEKMVEIAEKLSSPFPHVRVDLYNIDGKIIFGELTFFTNGGVIPFDPDSFDYEIGKAFELPKKRKLN